MATTDDDDDDDNSDDDWLNMVVTVILFSFQYLAFKDNPYILVPFGPYITTPVQKLWFEDCDSQREIVPQPANPGDPFISRSPTGLPQPNGTLLSLNDTHNELGLHDFVHQDNAYYVQLFFTPGQPGPLQTLTFLIWVFEIDYEPSTYQGWGLLMVN